MLVTTNPALLVGLLAALSIQQPFAAEPSASKPASAITLTKTPRC